MTPISRRIRKAREIAGLTLAALAKKCGMSKAGLWQVEQGRSEPGLTTAAKIAKALDVSLDWIATGVAHPDVAALRKTLAAVRKAANP
jgi:transcriptional regulator with XRE-family HTH domain